MDFVDSACLLGQRCLHARFLSSSHGRCCGLLAEIVRRMCGVFLAVISIQGCNAMSVALEKAPSGSRLRVSSHQGWSYLEDFSRTQQCNSEVIGGLDLSHGGRHAGRQHAGAAHREDGGQCGGA